MDVHTQWSICGSPRTTYRSPFSPPIWILKIKLGSPDLVAHTLRAGSQFTGPLIIPKDVPHGLKTT